MPAKNEQLQFIEDFKQTLLESDGHNAVITFDEFSISTKPSNYYGWAERNTRPRIKTDEKNEREPTDCQPSNYFPPNAVFKLKRKPKVSRLPTLWLI